MHVQQGSVISETTGIVISQIEVVLAAVEVGVDDSRISLLMIWGEAELGIQVGVLEAG
jgi:hypothetical protein